jgi:hypothetical protein
MVFTLTFSTNFAWIFLKVNINIYKKKKMDWNNYLRGQHFNCIENFINMGLEDP